MSTASSDERDKNDIKEMKSEHKEILLQSDAQISNIQTPQNIPTSRYHKHANTIKCPTTQTQHIQHPYQFSLYPYFGQDSSKYFKYLYSFQPLSLIYYTRIL